MHTSKKQAGFAHIGLILMVLVVIAAVVGIGWFVMSKDKNSGMKGATDTGWQDGCSGAERVALTHSPMDLEDVFSISPLGLTAGAHVTPIDHLYFYPKEGPRDKYPVYAMADGDIIEITSRAVNVSSGEKRPPEYRIIMQHSCQTITYFDLVTKLDKSITDKFPNATTEGMKGRFPIKAGQEIGRIGEQSLDTAVYNLDLTLPGFLHPKEYTAEPWKIHTDDFFSYFNDELQAQFAALNTRKVEPLSGKIDYDQAGKLIGNWFREGTDGYAGDPKLQGVGKNNQGYWTGHLAIFPYALDPTQIVVSIGDWKDHQPTAFFVTGNTPDPATVSTESGTIKYELIPLQPGGGNATGTSSSNSNLQVAGTVLLKVLPGEKLKVETFPGRSAASVSDFTSAARTYYR